jgi:DNA-binding Xre family transcriptional regulator
LAGRLSSHNLQITALVLASLVLEPDDGSVDPVDQFGENVRAARVARGWTQEDLAEEAGLASVQVSRIERGKREIRLTTFLRLLSALDAEPSELLKKLI